MLNQSNNTVAINYPLAVSEEEVTALYSRLSQDDKQEGDSNSIINQKKILKKYALEHGYKNYLYILMMDIPAPAFKDRIFNE